MSHEFIKTTWNNGASPAITAEQLNRIEDGIADAIDAVNDLETGKQDELTFDSTPTLNSQNPVTSGGIKQQLDLKADLESPTFTGTPQVPTPTESATQQIANVGFVTEIIAPIANRVSDVEDYTNALKNTVIPGIDESIGNLQDNVDDLESAEDKLAKAISTNEETMTATKNYAVGDLVMVNNQLYRVTSPIASGSTLTPSVNVITTTIGVELDTLEAEVEDQIPAVDNTLAVAGAAADAKKTGDELTNLLSALNTVFSKEAKQILLDCLSHMYWTSDDGVEYIDALREALNASARRPELPDTYEQVEYINGDGTQWSTFDIISQIPFSIEAKVLYKGINTNIFTGDSGTVGANSFFRFLGYNDLGSRSVADIGVRIGSYAWVYSHGYSIDTVYDVKSGVYKSGNDNISYVQVNDNERVEHTLTGTLSLGHPMRLYKRDGDSWVGRGTYIYSLVCYAGGYQKIFDGIPCYRKADNVGGLYDAVTDTFYPSEGTNNYIVGPVVK